MIRVIVNADDFGLDENRTKAILQAYGEGWISTTTAMVNMPWFAKALELAKGSRLYHNIGLHLNLTEGQPLTEPIKKSPLFCNEDGTFNARFHHSKLHRLWLSPFERRAVAEEAQAQFDVYRQSGLTLYHLDSHHHVHTDWAIASIILPLAKVAGFKTVRLSRNFGPGLSLFKKLYKSKLNRKLSHWLSPNVDIFCNFGNIANESNLMPQNARVEVMSHPLYSQDHQLNLYGNLTEFHGEYASILKFWNHVPANIQLVDYQGPLR